MSAADFSRDPSDYRRDPNGHCRRREDERLFPPGMIRECIESGAAEVQDNGRIKLTANYIGYDFSLIVDPDEELVVTCIVPDEWEP